MAQAGGKDPGKLDEALAAARARSSGSAGPPCASLPSTTAQPGSAARSPIRAARCPRLPVINHRRRARSPSSFPSTRSSGWWSAFPFTSAARKAVRRRWPHLLYGTGSDRRIPVETYDERLTTRMADASKRAGAAAAPDSLAAAHLCRHTSPVRPRSKSATMSDDRSPSRRTTGGGRARATAAGARRAPRQARRKKVPKAKKPAAEPDVVSAEGQAAQAEEAPEVKKQEIEEQKPPKAKPASRGRRIGVVVALGAGLFRSGGDSRSGLSPLSQKYAAAGRSGGAGGYADHSRGLHRPKLLK